jgi:ribonuclease P protein component
VSRKVSSLAVQRNRIKRQVKEYFRHNGKNLRGYDLVVMSIGGTADRSNKEIQNDLRQLWSQLEKRLSLS